MNAEQISAHLRGRFTGPGRYLAHCPVPGHGKGRGDRNPSLSIWQREDGGVGLHCFVGCDPRDVVAELRRLNLPPDDAERRSKASFVNGQGGSQKKSRHVTHYDYVDEGGTPLFQVVRTEPKGFFQRRSDGHGGWIYNLDDVRRVPYRLPDVLEALSAGHPILIVEGEKDVDALWALNLPATCNPGGAGKWRDDYGKFFRDADVVIVPDNDAPGRNHATDVAGKLHAIAGRVRIMDLPGVPSAGDVSDWLAAGGSVEQLRKLIDQAAEWAPPDEPRAQDQRTENDWWRAQLINIRDLCDQEFAEVKYVVPGLFPEGVTLLASRPKLGKSWMLLQIGTAIASGTSTLVINDQPAHGDVLYLALEDNPRRLQRRMHNLFGNNKAVWPDRFTPALKWKRLDQGGLEALRQWCQSVRQPTLIMIDTLKKIRAPKKKNETDYDADYEACQGLQQLAGEFGIAIIVAHHDRKMDAEDVFDTVSGTLGLTGGVDTIAIIKRRGSAVTLHLKDATWLRRSRKLSNSIERHADGQS